MKPDNTPHPRLVLAALLIFVALFHFVTMPKFHYQGDNLAIKAEAAHMVNTGRVGFAYGEKEALGDLATMDGQYFFANESSQRLFSKYGFFYSASYLPPVWLKKLVTGSLEVVDISEPMTFAFNCYNILWSLLYLIYLYRLYRHFGLGRGLAVALVFLSVYPSYIWYYLRSPDKEVLQMVSFTGAVYHALRYLGSRREGRPSSRHLAAALAWGGYTYLLKPLYALLLVAIGGAVLTDALLGRWRRSGAPRTAWRGAYWRPLCTLGAGAVLIIALSLAHNYLRSGEIFDAGYRQDSTVPIEFVFTAGHFFRGLATYFVLPGVGNWFLHQPLLILAVFGYPAFYRKHPMESWFLIAVFTTILVALCFHVEWVGEWCYGPRFCLHLIMIAVIPAVEVLPRLVAWPKGIFRRAIKVLAVVACAGITLVSLQAQVYINTWYYFTFYAFSTQMAMLNSDMVNQYFDTMPHRAQLNRDLTLYRHHGRKFALLESIDQAQLPAGTVAAIYGLTDELIDRYSWNFLFLPPPGP
jgi:hypothetical protein